MSRRNSRTNHDEDYVDVPLVSEEENDPELEKVLAKIQKLNDLEEAGTNPKKRKKAEPPPPQPAPPPQALPQAPPLKAARKSRGGKAVLDPLPGQAWHPAEAALLLILITGQVPVVKLPSEGRITNQYKSVFYYYFSISLSLRVLSEAFADLVGEPITPQRIKSKLETVEMKGKLSRAKVLPIPSAKPVPQQNFPLYDNPKPTLENKFEDPIQISTDGVFMLLVWPTISGRDVFLSVVGDFLQFRVLLSALSKCVTADLVRNTCTELGRPAPVAKTVTYPSEQLFMLRLPTSVVDGGDHTLIREDGFFGIRLQVRREFKSQQAVQSLRSAEIEADEKRITEDKRVLSLVHSVDRGKLLAMLGGGRNNTNDFVVNQIEIRDQLAMDVEPVPVATLPLDDDDDTVEVNDYSIHTSDGTSYSDDDEDEDDLLDLSS